MVSPLGPQSPGAAPEEGKSGFVTMMLAFAPAIFGFCGLHRIYTGHIGIGIAQFLTLGGCGLWQLYDIYLLFTRQFRDKEGRDLKRDHPARQLMK